MDHLYSFPKRHCLLQLRHVGTRRGIENWKYLVAEMNLSNIIQENAVFPCSKVSHMQLLAGFVGYSVAKDTVQLLLLQYITVRGLRNTAPVASRAPLLIFIIIPHLLCGRYS